MDANKHRYYMMQVLLAIFKDKTLRSLLAFKGGTALMFFHGLTRFSTDLDFNLLDETQQTEVYQRLHKILSSFGKIDDEAQKFYGTIHVMSYGKGERMLKVEVSNRQYDNHYEIHNLLGTDIRVMTKPDMFAHKLCALGERQAPRDIYDVNFFLQQRMPINENIVRLRTNMSVAEYAGQCADKVRSANEKVLMQGLGEVLLDNISKNYVRKQLLQDTATNLELFSMYPIIAQQPCTNRQNLLLEHPQIMQIAQTNDVDLSLLTINRIRTILEGNSIALRNRKGEEISLNLR